MTDFLFFPRLHTAIAELIACLLMMCRVPRRFSWKRMTLIYILFGAVLIALNMFSQRISGVLWVALMGGCMFSMLALIWSCCRLSVREALYRWAFAFVLAEFSASLEWMVNFYLLESGTLHGPIQTFLSMWVFYLVTFGLIYFINRHNDLAKEKITVTHRDTVTVVSIAMTAFALSNLNFILAGSLFSQSQGAGVLYTRTLVDLGGLLTLYMWEEGRRALTLQYERDAIESLFDRQYEQYRQFEANNEELHRIYHDLKHQIAYLESESDFGKRTAYLAEMKQAIETREAMVQTNSSVLDTLLTNKNMLCISEGIAMRCYADADCISFMNTMDICSLFGNAIDNAIEYEMSVTDTQKRLISLDVYRENQFAVIRIANYCEDELSFENDMPVTTKKDRRMHGFGVKSIRRIVEKYHGHMSITVEDNWFALIILLPIYKK